MCVRSAGLLAIFVLAVAGCGGGDAVTPAHEPVRPAPIVAWAPPAPSRPPRTIGAPPSNPTPASAAPRHVPELPSEPAQHCALDGVARFAPNTPIQNTDGRVIGRFSGAATHVAVSELTLALPSRARIETGEPRGTFRVHGFVLASDLPLFTNANVPVAAGHLAIGAHRSASVTSMSPDKVRLEHVAAAPLGQTLATWTTCGALSLDAGTPPSWSPAGDARGYALRKDALELFDTPNGAAVGSVQRAPGAPSVLFFGGEQSGGFVHVERHTDVVIDAWARASDLAALPRGETQDQAEPPVTSHGSPHLALANEPRVLKTSREVALRAEARELAVPIGSIGADTEAYVIEVMAGWVSVIPKAMDVLPPDGGAFWAKKSDLGL